MADLRTKLVVDLTGNLASQAQKHTSALTNMGQRGSRAMHGLSRSVHEVSRGLDRIGNRYTAMLTGAIGIGAIKSIGDLSMRLTYLGIQANASAADIDKLYASIQAVAQAQDIRVDPSGLLGAVEVIVEKLGDLDLAKDNLRNIGLAMRATGAEGKDVGDMVANFKEKFALSTNDEIFKALDLLVNQGKAGAFTLKDLVTQGNRVTAAYGSMGATGIEGIRQMGAVLQVFRKSSGSAEETSTAFKNVFNDLMEKSDKLDKYMGKKNFIWDPKALKEGQKVIRPITDILYEMLVKSKGDPQKLGKVFGMQSMDGYKAAINSYRFLGMAEKSKGDVQKLAEWMKAPLKDAEAIMAQYKKYGKNPFAPFLDVPSDGKSLLADSGRAAKEFNAAVESLHAAWKKFANDNLSGPVKQLADTLNGLDEATVQRWLNMGKNIALVGAGLIALNKVGKFVGWTSRLFGRGPGAGGMLGKLGGGGMPVAVTNWPVGFGGKGLPGVPNTGSSTPQGLAILNTPLGAAGGVLAVGAIVAGTVYASQLVGKEIGEWQASKYSTDKLQQMINENTVMGIGGADSATVKIMEAEQSRRLAETAELLKQNNVQTLEELRRLNVEFDKKVRIGISIDSEGRPKTSVQNSNKNVEIDVDAGWMMVTP